MSQQNLEMKTFLLQIVLWDSRGNRPHKPWLSDRIVTLSRERKGFINPLSDRSSISQKAKNSLFAVGHLYQMTPEFQIALQTASDHWETHILNRSTTTNSSESVVSFNGTVIDHKLFLLVILSLYNGNRIFSFQQNKGNVWLYRWRFAVWEITSRCGFLAIKAAYTLARSDCHNDAKGWKLWMYAFTLSLHFNTVVEITGVIAAICLSLTTVS